MIYLRRNNLQNAVGEFYDVSQYTISRVSMLAPLVRAEQADAVFADKGYKGSGYFIPSKKPAGGD